MSKQPVTVATYVKVGERYRVHHDGALHEVTLVRADLSKRCVVIAFDDGTAYECHPSEALFFPRRNDGAIVDWAAEGRDPLPSEVYALDRIPDAFTVNGERVIVGDPVSIVTVREVKDAVYPSYDVFIQRDRSAGVERHRFYADEPVMLPHEPDVEVKGLRAYKTGEPEWHGPYVHEVTGARFMLAEHPTGRGRWPKGIEPFDATRPPLPNDGTYKMRYPRWDWPKELKPTGPGMPVGHVRAYSRLPSHTGSIEWN